MTPVSPRPRKLIWVGVLPPHQGGAAVSAFQMLTGLSRLGHSIRCVAPVAKEAIGDAETFVVRHPEFHVTWFPMPYPDIGPNMPSSEHYRHLETTQTEAALVPLIEHERPDVIILGRETFAWRAPEIARRYGVPCILRIAGGFLTGIEAGNYSPDLVARWVAQVRMVDAIIGQTTSVAAQLAAVGFTDMQIIPNAIDLNMFGPAPSDASLRRALGIADDRIVAMHLSNLKLIKRATEVVGSAVLALRENPKLVYVIVGDGPERGPMEAAVRRDGIADHVRFAGWIEYARVKDYINLADMVLMPSDAEAQARVYLETQACGRTLIASDIPAARHVVEDGKTGLLFRKGDVADLAAKTLRAAADPALRAAIGANALKRVAAHSLDHIAAQYSDVIEDVLARRGAR